MGRENSAPVAAMGNESRCDGHMNDEEGGDDEADEEHVDEMELLR